MKMTMVIIMVTILLTVVVAGKIDHVVVVMLENRSFDHMFGAVEGMGLNKSNDWNPVKGVGKIVVDSNTPYVARCGPDHSTNGTTKKIFPLGIEAGPTMMGFAQEEAAQNNTNGYCDVMSTFPKGRLPVTHWLGKAYVCFE